MSDPLSTFRNMKSRCYNPKDKKYEYYGGKGITICEQWLKNPVAFAKWAENNGWGEGMQIHRINNAPIYSPETCEFLTRKRHEDHHKNDPKDKPINISIIMKVELVEKLNKFANIFGISRNKIIIRAIENRLESGM